MKGCILIHQHVLTFVCVLYDRKLAMSLMLWTMVQVCSPRALRKLLILLPAGLVQTQRSWKKCQKMHWNWLSQKLSLTLSETSMSSPGSKAWYHRSLVPWLHPSSYHHQKPHLSNLSETSKLRLARIAIVDIVNLAFSLQPDLKNGTSCSLCHQWLVLGFHNFRFICSHGSYGQVHLTDRFSSVMMLVSCWLCKKPFIHVMFLVSPVIKGELVVVACKIHSILCMEMSNPYHV